MPGSTTCAGGVTSRGTDHETSRRARPLVTAGEPRQADATNERTPAETVIVLNPQSGSGRHVESVRRRAELRDYPVRQTEAAGDAIRFAREAAEAGTDTVVAAGGDGTVNEVIQGIDRAGALDDVTLAILPVGTGNNFATNIGITDLDTGFAVVAEGERRRIDLGQADGRPFLNSCVAGLTADASDETSHEAKHRLGVLAYVVTTLRSVSDFEALRLAVDIDAGGTETTAWAGEAICVLVGNGRRFTAGGSEQADMEDGRFDVTVIEDIPAIDLMSELLVERLLGARGSHLVRTQAPAVTITIGNPESVRFSLDGEIIEARELSLRVRPKALTVAVGDGYRPHPE